MCETYNPKPVPTPTSFVVKNGENKWAEYLSLRHDAGDEEGGAKEDPSGRVGVHF